MRLHAVCLFLLIFFSAAAALGQGEKGFSFSKQPELQQIKPLKPVKIKLKRSAKNEYTWELNGDDADEIIRVDRKLRKLLNTQ